MRRDRKQLYYAPLQGETATALRAVHPQIPRTLESVVLVDGSRAYLRSQAFVYAAQYLTWPWKFAYYLRWIPAFILDVVYRAVARIRYRVWGKLDTCTAPTAGDASRLLP